ncbi:hypothetical protein M0R45_017030 [Rubus argutus]|uniref:Uncharacterized protein n=1 Tax=Rubus argutus TaxID=59490 RepID=A0AAW1XWU6_RUBAR
MTPSALVIATTVNPVQILGIGRGDMRHIYEIQRLGFERPQTEEDLYNPFELDEHNEDEDRIVSEKRDYYSSESVVVDVGRCCVMLAGAGSLDGDDEVRENTVAEKNPKINGGNIAQETDVKDFLDILLDMLEGESSENAGVDFSRNHIKGLITDLFAASIDTTSISMEWALAEVINHPESLLKRNPGRMFSSTMCGLVWSAPPSVLLPIP